MAEVKDHNFEERIRERYEALSKGQKELAQVFLAKNPNIAFLSAAQLAKELGTSRSSLVRFAQALGYEGYPQLQKDVQQHFRDQLTPSTAFHTSLETVKSEDEGVFSVFRKAVEVDRTAINQLEEQISKAAFEAAVETIANSKRIYVFGLGVARSLVDFLAFRLRRYGFNVQELKHGGTELYDYLFTLDEDTCLVAFAFHRYPKELSVALEHAIASKTKTILISDDQVSPYAGIADITLAARRGPSGIMHSLAVPMAIANALVLAVGYHDDGKVFEMLEKLDEVRYAYEDTIPIHERQSAKRDKSSGGR